MRSFKEFIIEKLKVSKNIKTGPTLRDFIDFYMRNSNWKWADLHNIMFGYGMWGENNEFKTWEEFKDFLEYNIDKNIKVELNRTDSSSLGINTATNQLINQYIFEVDNVEFVININKYARKDTFEDWFKAKYPDVLFEKLKISKDFVDGNIKSTLKGFFLWYWGYETINDDFWDAMYTIEFSNNVIEEYFNDSMNDFVDWFGKNMDDIVYFDEVKDGRENYKYTFNFDEITFEIFAWVSPENNTYPFSKSKYIIKRLHEKLKVSAKPKVINCTVRQLFKNEFDRKFNYNDLVGFFTDVRKEHFDDNVYDLIAFLKEHANDKIEVTREIEDIIDGFGEVVKYSFTLDGIEFSDIIVVEYVTEKLKISSNAKPDVIDCTVKQFMDWFWRDKDSKYTGEDLELFQFGGDAILQISPTMNDYDKMYIFLKWREDEDIEVTEQIESGRSHKLNTDWQYGIYTFTLDGVAFDVTAPFSSDEDPFSVYYEKLMEIEL